MRYIEAARAGGDRIATGGNRLARDGFFIEPTVIVPKSINSALVRDEIFGPVLCIMPFDTLEEAVALANDTPYGLAACPVVKVATRSDLARRWHDLMDINAGRIADGQASIEDLGWEMFRYLLDVASGRKRTWAEHWRLHNALVLFNPAPVT
jgi:acyl-CoA reductase-like NAD-dependent aldehyde dehydrogenase